MNKASKEVQVNFIKRKIEEKLNLREIIKGKNAEEIFTNIDKEIEILEAILWSVQNNEFNEYQSAALRTANQLTDDQLIMNGVLGVNGEAGEIADLMKKATFQGHELNRERLLEEVGDVMWYCAILSKGLGSTLSDVANRNVQKLLKRYPNGFNTQRSQNRGEENEK